MDKTSVRCCALLGGVLVTNRVPLGICAMDYLAGNDPRATGNTPGLIVDDVSCQRITNFVPIRSFDFLGHARNHGEISSSGMSLDSSIRCELAQ